MKSANFVRFIYIILIFCTQNIVFAESYEITFKVATRPNLNLRAEPSIGSEIIGKISFNSEVTGRSEDAVEDTVDGYVDKWYLVKYKRRDEEKEGYLWGRYLVITSTGYGKAVISGGLIVKDGASLLSEPNVYSKVIKKLEFGTFFYVLEKKAFYDYTSGRKSYWYNVVFPDDESSGWITSGEGKESYFWRETYLRDKYAGSYFSIASDALWKHREYDVAERLFKFILEKYSDAEIPIHDDFYGEIYITDARLKTMNSLAWTYRKQKKYKKAVEQFKKISDNIKFKKEDRAEAFWEILKIYKEDLKDYKTLITLSHEAIENYKNHKIWGFEWNCWLDIEAAEYLRSALENLNADEEEIILHGKKIINETDDPPVVILGNLILCDGYKKSKNAKKMEETILSTIGKYPTIIRRYYLTPVDYTQRAIAELIRYYVEELSDYESAIQFCRTALKSASNPDLIKSLEFAKAQLYDIWHYDKEAVVEAYEDCRGVRDYISRIDFFYDRRFSNQRLKEIKSFIEHEAVVIEPELSVRLKPLDTSKTLFALSKGDKINVLYRNPNFFEGNWVKIKAQNKFGWVEDKSVKNVNIKELSKIKKEERWEHYRKNIENLGSINGEPIVKPQLLWQIPRVNAREVIYYDVNDDMVTDLIIAGYEDEYLAVLDGRTQNVIWKTSIKRSNTEYFSPCVYKNYIVFGDKRYVKFFDIKNGHLEKTLYIDKISAPISIYEDKVFVQTSQYEKRYTDKVVGIDIDSEKTVWESPDKYRHGNSALAIDKKENVIYVVNSVNGNRNLSAIDMQNRGKLWTFTMGSTWCRVSPVIYEDYVLVGSNDWHLYILNKYTGQLHYKFNVGQPLTAELSLNNGIVVAAPSNCRLCAVDIKEGKKIWEFVAKEEFLAAPCIINNVVYAGDRAGFVYAVSLETGELIWEYEAGSEIRGSISSNGSMISFVTSTNNLFVLGNSSE